MHRFGDILVTQSVDRYKRDLGAWEAKVQRVREPMDALRVAGFPPTPGPIISSRSALTDLPAAHTRLKVERILLDKVAVVGADDPDMPHLMRMAAGHWPRVHRSLAVRAAKDHSGIICADQGQDGPVPH